MTHSPTPWHVSKLWLDEIYDAAGMQIALASFTDGRDFKNAEFIVAAVNSYEPREDLIRKLITALADVRDREPSAWSALQEHTLDLSREMGF